FVLGAYDARQPLTIDPTLSYSTPLGGSGDDEGTGIAVDAAGFIYVTGDTYSSDFPHMGGQNLSGGRDALVMEIDPRASGAAARVYSTLYTGTHLPAHTAGLAVVA